MQCTPKSSEGQDSTTPVGVPIVVKNVDGSSDHSDFHNDQDSLPDKKHLDFNTTKGSKVSEALGKKTIVLGGNEIIKQNLQGINQHLKKAVTKMTDPKEQASAIKEINSLKRKNTVTENQMSQRDLLQQTSNRVAG